MPDSGAFHNELAWCLTLTDRVPEGLAEARKAVELQPSRTHYDTLAMALALSGQGDEALATEENHVMANGSVANDAERVTLGMVYYAVGRKEEAHRQWETARTGSDTEARKLALKFEAKYP